ncbi:MAG: FixH family protein [Bacteroidales bacterium]|jgi:hypothetical protein|nr:FixH family protein [Bacteroidales bacterium]MCK9448259.1 FixH family protein [Bacteroidales bacterium]MDD3700479.1 FixH family protein [Bacteroidales bacterium]MDY0369871.1 FixH family protein [Bacteroidales bacterium]
MKWNWGTKLTLAIIAFMLMIIVFAILMMRETISLVDKDYYPKGQSHQELIDKKQNAYGLEHMVKLEKTDSLVRLVLPPHFQLEGVSGEVYFYQRMDDKGDRHIPLTISDEKGFILPVSELKGRFIARIDWQYEGNAYYVEKEITFP